ncbi:MAG TPA: deoxyribonuclease IV [Desulfomicrobiaceae bacterium]|nr:deoxyribonuclease IV [Desulfomicrobiaceae bacterium]
MRYLGSHMSIAGSLCNAFKHIQAVGGTALQLFTRNQRQWKIPLLSDDDIHDVAAAWKAWGDYPVVAHDSYLINLAGNKPEGVRKSEHAFTEELKRIEALSIPCLITHPGSHLGDGTETGLKRYVRRLDRCLELSETKAGTVLLETTAGQGTNLGSSFEELAFIIEHSRFPDRLGVCLDTCHVFAAGYELRTPKGYRETMDRFNRVIGTNRLRCIHVNDSIGDLGCRKDRHDHIGAGMIGIQGFANLVNDPALDRIPFILETPKGRDLHEDVDNMNTLKGLITHAA